MKRNHPVLLLLLPAALFTSACSKPVGSSVAADPAVVVRWADLKSLDELAEQAESSGESGPIVDIRNLGKEIKPVAMQVAGDPLPPGTHQPEKVQLLQKDLASLAQSLADPATLPEKDLRSTIQGFHPIVEQLMEASGMPHVHEHPADGAAASASSGKEPANAK